jgi:CshA-type fibril repeat protein
VVTFTPTTGFTGTAPAVTYQATTNTNQTLSGSVTGRVLAPPALMPDTSTGAYNTPQTKNLISNDSSASGTTLVPSSMRLCDPTTSPAQVAPNCNKTSVTVPGEGTYVLSGTTVTFTPVASLATAATPLKYSVADALGQVSESTYTATVSAPPAPTAVADTMSGAVGATQSVNVLSNDTVGAAGVTIVASTAKLCASNQTAPNCSATSVVVNGGTYSIDNLGVVTFTPTSGFSGVAPAVTYQATTNTGQVLSGSVTARTIGAPSLQPDSTTGTYNGAQTLNVLANDAAASGTTLVPSSIKLCGPSDTAPACTQTTVVVAGQGTYSLSGTSVVFTPLSLFCISLLNITVSLVSLSSFCLCPRLCLK